MVSTLLEFGASIDKANSRGQSPFDLAKQNRTLQKMFFYHLTGGEGKAEAFFEETARNFASIIKTMKKKEQIDPQVFFSAIRIE